MNMGHAGPVVERSAKDRDSVVRIILRPKVNFCGHKK